MSPLRGDGRSESRLRASLSGHPSVHRLWRAFRMERQCEQGAERGHSRCKRFCSPEIPTTRCIPPRLWKHRVNRTSDFMRREPDRPGREGVEEASQDALSLNLGHWQQADWNGAGSLKAYAWNFQHPCAIVRFMPQGDLCRLAEQKRAAAEEMRRVARTLWFCTDRSRVMRRAAELEAESKWLILDAAVAVAARLSRPATHQQQQAERGEEKGKS